MYCFRFHNYKSAFQKVSKSGKTSKVNQDKSSHRRFLWKKVFLKMSQNWQENNCVGVSFFNKVSGFSPAILWKKRTPTQVFSCEFCKMFEDTYFGKHLRTTTFVKNTLINTFNYLKTKILINIAEIRKLKTLLLV